MDANVGRLLDRLEAHGLRENTLVIFTSDNGMSMGSPRRLGKGNGTFPINMYDQAVKVPTLVSRPDRSPRAPCATPWRATTTSCPRCSTTWVSTIPKPPICPVRASRGCFGARRCPERDAVVIYDEYGPVRMIRTRQWKYVRRYPYGPDELYDLVNDPDEETNLVKDPEHEETRCQMRAQLKEWFLKYVDPERDGKGLPVYGDCQIERVDPKGRGRVAFIEPME